MKLYGERFNSKLRISRFGTQGLDCIHQLSETTTRAACRACYNIPATKICITCGYSAYAEQHQDQCLIEIMKLPEAIRKKIFVIIPMQYGRFNVEYIKQVEALQRKCDFDCIILDSFVPFEMSAKLAIATDIYLHLRDTDAFSNALKEHVFAKSIIIAGKWLKYIELENMKAPIITISSFAELTPVLQETITSFKPSDKINLFTPIYQMYSTKSVNEQWRTTVDFALTNSRTK